MNEERKQQIIDAGARLAAKHGAVNVTRRMVADKIKVTEALLNRYVGGKKKAQKAYAKRAAELGLKEPSAEKIEQIGINLRKHQPADARDTRKRSSKEVKAIKDKKAAAKKSTGGRRVVVKKAAAKKAAPAPAKKVVAKKVVAKKAAAKKVVPAKKVVKKAAPAPAKKAVAASAKVNAVAERRSTKPNQNAAQRSTAARAPKLPPTLPPPLPPVDLALPPTTDTLKATI